MVCLDDSEIKISCYPLADLGGVLQPPSFGLKFLPKRSCFASLKLQLPFPDHMVNNRSHERLQPQKCLDTPMLPKQFSSVPDVTGIPVRHGVKRMYFSVNPTPSYLSRVPYSAHLSY